MDWIEDVFRILSGDPVASDILFSGIRDVEAAIEDCCLELFEADEANSVGLSD